MILVPLRVLRSKMTSIEVIMVSSNGINCVNNKMLESDRFLTALIYYLIWLMQHQNCPI